jgi:hypothetical protein
MPNRPPNPDSVSALRKEIQSLSDDFAEFRESLAQPSRLRVLVSEHPVWSKVTAGLILAMLLGICGVAKGLIHTSVDSYVGGRITAITNPIGDQIRGFDDRIRGVDERLSRVEGMLGGIQLKGLANNPSDPKSIKEAQDVLRTARLDKVQVNNATVADAGGRFLEASSKSPDAWATVLEFLNYRAYVNSVTVPLGPQLPISESLATKYVINKDNIPTLISMRTIGTSKSPDVPQLRALSEPDSNRDLAAGPSLLVVDAPTVVLDNLVAKKVVFVNSHIIYRGGAVVLDNVYFLNCTFEIEKKTQGQELAARILSGPVTNFVSG